MEKIDPSLLFIRKKNKFPYGKNLFFIRRERTVDYLGFFVVTITIAVVAAGLIWLNHALAKNRMRLLAKKEAKAIDLNWKRTDEYVQKILNNFPAIMKKMIAEMTEVVNDM